MSAKPGMSASIESAPRAGDHPLRMRGKVQYRMAINHIERRIGKFQRFAIHDVKLPL